MHEIMTVSYFQAMYALSLMNGPNINDWAHAQVTTLRDRSTRAQNPIPRADEQHWNDFKAAFEHAFTDIAKEQTAMQKLMVLRLSTYYLCRSSKGLNNRLKVEVIDEEEEMGKG
jgi:hypothetical protein